MEIRNKIKNGWYVIARRWVVERSFAWLNNFRRLSKSYERFISSAENMIMIPSGVLLLKRVVKKGAMVVS